MAISLSVYFLYSGTNDQCDGKSCVQFLIYNHCTNDIWFTNGYCISGHVQDCIDCSDTANITSKICNIQVFVLLTGIYKICLFFVQVFSILGTCSNKLKTILIVIVVSTVLLHIFVIHKYAQVFILAKSLDRSCKSKSFTATDLGKVQKCNVEVVLLLIYVIQKNCIYCSNTAIQVSNFNYFQRIGYVRSHEHGVKFGFMSAFGQKRHQPSPSKNIQSSTITTILISIFRILHQEV
ncbi:hypothetical protein ACTA71_010013 [Dictyostelium dimigraforme]